MTYWTMAIAQELCSARIGVRWIPDYYTEASDIVPAMLLAVNRQIWTTTTTMMINK